MSSLYDLVFQRNGELQTQTVQVADDAQAWCLGVSAISTASAALSIGMAPQLSHPNVAKRRATEMLGI